jgi:hypothetical protein
MNMTRSIHICIAFALPICMISCAWISNNGKVLNQPVIINPSFEKDHAGWASEWFRKALFEDDSTAYYLETGDAHTGEHAIRIVNKRPNDANVLQDIAVLPDSIYHVSCWIKVKGIAGNAGANVSVIDSVAMSEFVFDTQGQWRFTELYGMTGPYQTKIKMAARIGAWGTTATGEALFDDMAIEFAKSVPPGFDIQSFTFNDKYTEERGKTYFSWINDERRISNRLSMSIMIAALTLAAFFLFAVYMFFLNGKLPKLDRLYRTGFTRWKFVSIAISFIVFFVVYAYRKGVQTSFDIQCSFVLFGICVAGIAGYLYKTKQLTKESIMILIVLLGIALRLCYFLYTPYADKYSNRQFDTWGPWSHTEYIKYIAAHFSLPPVGAYETYHPPVHYILCAVVLKVAELFGAGETLAFQAVQVYLVFLSSLIIILANRIFKLIGCDENVRIVGVAVMSFFPSLVLMSVTLTNDITVSFFFTLGLYRLIVWKKEPSVKNAVVLAIATALAVLSKKSAYILFILAGIVFFVELYKHRKEAGKYIKLALIFLSIAVPLGASFQVRNYILFQQGPSYTFPFTNAAPSNNPYHLVGVPVGDLLEQPFISKDDSKRTFMIGELIRTALFETYLRNREYGSSLPGIDDAATLLMLFFLVNLVLMLLYLISSRKDDYMGDRYIFLLTFVFSILVFLQMRFSTQYLMVYDFRYLAPFISVPLAYFIAQANVKFADCRIRLFRYLVPAQFVLWCASSVCFFLLVGF